MFGTSSVCLLHFPTCRGCQLDIEITQLWHKLQYINIGITFFPGEGDVWFSLNGKTYQNNSCVSLEDIGEGNDSLLCVTKYTACCTCDFTGTLASWFFPNGTKIPINETSGEPWDFYRTSSYRVVGLNRRRNGVDGIYRCEIPDSMNVTQTIYIGVYTANTSTGE